MPGMRPSAAFAEAGLLVSSDAVLYQELTATRSKPAETNVLTRSGTVSALLATTLQPSTTAGLASVLQPASYCLPLLSLPRADGTVIKSYLYDTDWLYT